MNCIWYNILLHIKWNGYKNAKNNLTNNLSFNFLSEVSTKIRPTHLYKHKQGVHNWAEYYYFIQETD